MKKIFSLSLIVLGIASLVYSIIQYRLIYNNFWKHEQYFINWYLDTILIALGFVGIFLIIVGSLVFRKTIRKTF